MFGKRDSFGSAAAKVAPPPPAAKPAERPTPVAAAPAARYFPAENIRPPLPNRLPRSSFLPGVAWSAPVFFRRWLPNGWVQANLLTETLHTKKKPHNSPK